MTKCNFLTSAVSCISRTLIPFGISYVSERSLTPMLTQVIDFAEPMGFHVTQDYLLLIKGWFRNWKSM